VRTVLLANNRLGADVARHLAARGDLQGIVLVPEPRQRHAEDLRAIGVPTWTWPDGHADVVALDPECLLSVLFTEKVPPAWLDVPSWRALNLHPSLLPWNRGAAPNVWPLVDGSPAGVSLHVMVPAIDAGDVVAQDEVEVRPDDTAETLYRRLEAAGLALVERVWPSVRDVEPVPQQGEGTTHRVADLASLDLTEDDLGVLDRLRARTFGAYGAEVVRDGVRYVVQVRITPADPA
jgi:methionyl-tRNA formyltransferase